MGISERPHCHLEAWKQAMNLAQIIYTETRKLPAAERFGLMSQMRRCAVSIPSNIAEGACRGSRKDFIRFLRIARGSLGEIETQCYLARNLGYLEDIETITKLTNRVFRLLCGLISSLDSDK